MVKLMIQCSKLPEKYWNSRCDDFVTCLWIFFTVIKSKHFYHVYRLCIEMTTGNQESIFNLSPPRASVRHDSWISWTSVRKNLSYALDSSINRPSVEMKFPCFLVQFNRDTSQQSIAEKRDRPWAHELSVVTFFMCVTTRHKQICLYLCMYCHVDRSKSCRFQHSLQSSVKLLKVNRKWLFHCLKDPDLKYKWHGQMWNRKHQTSMWFWFLKINTDIWMNTPIFQSWHINSYCDNYSLHADFFFSGWYSARKSVTLTTPQAGRPCRVELHPPQTNRNVATSGNRRMGDNKKLKACVSTAVSRPKKQNVLEQVLNKIARFDTPTPASLDQLVLHMWPHWHLDLHVIVDGQDGQQRTGQILRSLWNGVQEKKTRSTASHAATRPALRLQEEEGAHKLVQLGNLARCLVVSWAMRLPTTPKMRPSAYTLDWVGGTVLKKWWHRGPTHWSNKCHAQNLGHWGLRATISVTDSTKSKLPTGVPNILVHFHPNSKKNTFIQNQKIISSTTLSSKNGFIQWNFHPKPHLNT